MSRALASRSRLVLLAVVAVSGLAALACALVAQGGESDEVVFMAGSSPQASLPFVGAYVAEAQGFFAEEGLEVRIEHSPDGVEHIGLLEEREVHFTTVRAADLIALRAERLARGESLDLVAVALFGQRGDAGYVVSRGSGIAAPADFAGKVVGITSGTLAPELRAMLDGAGLGPSDIRLERIAPGDVDRLLIGEVDVYPASIHDVPDTLRRLGYDVGVVDPADFGVPTLGLTMVTHRGLIEKDPELVERFMRAMLRGARYAAMEIDPALDVALRYAPGADPDHQSFLLENDLADAARDGGMGRAGPEQWQAVIDLMAEYGALAAPVEVSDVFDGSIIDGIYERDELE